MSFEITGHVPGLSDEQVAAIAEEAEAGYDVTDRTPEPTPPPSNGWSVCRLTTWMLSTSVPSRTASPPRQVCDRHWSPTSTPPE